MLKDKIENLIKISGVFLSESEIENLEVIDFGLDDFENVGLSIYTYFNTNRCCAKELIMLPNQTCPEHYHPDYNDIPGKEETFRCRFGSFSLFIQGKPNSISSVVPPKNGKKYYSVFHEVILKKGDQFTLAPNEKHWFQAHESGAVISEFSTHSNDGLDIFTDARINRLSFYKDFKSN